MNTIVERTNWFAPSGSPEQRAEQKEIDDRETAFLIGQHRAVMEQVYPGMHPEHRRPTLFQRLTGRG